jgi:hypothetical protein
MYPLDPIHKAYSDRGATPKAFWLWEARDHKLTDISNSVPCELRPNYRFSGACDATPGHPENPLTRIKEMCNEGDYCVFKLDIDTPNVEVRSNPQ